MITSKRNLAVIGILFLSCLFLFTGRVCAQDKNTSGGQASTLPHQKVIKDLAEYHAYMAALNIKDPAQKAAAMEAFIGQYPKSIMKIDALEQAMAAYQQAANQAGVENMAGRILQLDPEDIRVLAIYTFIQRAKGTSGDEHAAALVGVNAEKGLRLLKTWTKLEGMSDADFTKINQQMAGIFYGAAGFGALKSKDYVAARNFYLKSVEIDPNNIQDVYQLSISCLEMEPIDATGFWYIARTIHLSENNPEAKKAVAAYGKAKYLKYHGTADGWDEIVSKVSSQNVPPAGFAQSIKPLSPVVTK